MNDNHAEINFLPFINPVEPLYLMLKLFLLLFCFQGKFIA